MTDRAEVPSSLIGQGAHFHGKLSFLGAVRIEGFMEGEVQSEGTLIVAEGGVVRGTVHVGTLVITGGLVDATVRATVSVELHPPGRLQGEVETPALHIERGGVFHGTSHMPDQA
ncbi:MAG: polymer-forming cytoskeletal protein [Myxococcota bacterium]|jgi:cytoskeletal protein CcmA (bactofilin family)|nr:polymer-forming cytoskeletal protein [Myxococcota bacterium]